MNTLTGISETLGAFNIEFSTPLLGLTGGCPTLAAGASSQQAGVISSTVPTNTGINNFNININILCF